MKEKNELGFGMLVIIGIAGYCVIESFPMLLSRFQEIYSKTGIVGLTGGLIGAALEATLSAGIISYFYKRRAKGGPD